jgi:hypothetical protein
MTFARLARGGKGQPQDAGPLTRQAMPIPPVSASPEANFFSEETL